jgi:Tfp pilus assembly protein FimT
MDNKNKGKGWTTIELAMVMVIIGFFASIVLPAFSDAYDTFKIEGAYRQLMQDLRYAQQLAISQQVAHGIAVDSGTESYWVYRQSSANIVKDPSTQKPLTVSYLTGKFAGIQLVSTTYNFPTDRIEFNSLGEPLLGGTVTLNYGGTLTRCGRVSGGITRVINIESSTGRIY